MTVLFDTNVLARAAQPGHLQQQVALAAGDVLKLRGERLCLVPQVLYEFWTVCTRPADENGLGMSVAEARNELVKARSLFTIMPELPAVLEEWERLVTQYDVRGKSAHDARLVAAMKVHGISQILTFNPKDFRRYPDLIVLTPPDLAGMAHTPQ